MWSHHSTAILLHYILGSAISLRFDFWIKVLCTTQEWSGISSAAASVTAVVVVVWGYADDDGSHVHRGAEDEDDGQDKTWVLT